ncbi:MAG: DUF4124 domain-containing protein [Sulfuricella sp.]|nr:DUF4124 domain-containing protein [Sulfuricella sp.]
MRKISALFLLCLVSLPVSAGTIKKWVDEQGVTHYGDTIPPQYVNQSSTELSSKGVVVKKTERAQTAEERRAIEEEKVRQQETQVKEQEQQRRDKALLNTYTSEKEIDLSRDRNLQQAEVQTQSAELRIKQVNERLAKYRRQADGMTKAGKPVAADLKQDIDNGEREILHLQESIQQKKKDMEAIRARFEADKQRFRELTSRK